MLVRLVRRSGGSRFRRLRCGAVLALALNGALGRAAEAAPPELSLAEARQRAFAHNWDLLAAKSGVDAALAQRIVAREFPNPGLSLQSTQINVNGAGNSTVRGNGWWQRSYDSVVALNQLFEVGGKRSSRRASAEAGLAGAEARFADARRVLENGVTTAYVAAALADTKAEILRQSAASLRREAGIARSRLGAGDISRADEAQIEIAADRLELDALSADNDADAARIAVDALLGADDPSGNWRPADPLQSLALPREEDNAGTAAERPDLRAARADVAKADADLKLQRAQRIPDPTLALQYEHQPPDFPETVGVGVSFPLPLWNRNGGAIRAAVAARDQALQAQHKLQARIAAELATAQHAYQAAAERLRRQREQIEPRSAEARKAVAFAYEKGGASLVELLAAERNDNDVRLAGAQAAADAATALSALRAARNLTASLSSAR